MANNKATLLKVRIMKKTSIVINSNKRHLWIVSCPCPAALWWREEGPEVRFSVKKKIAS